MIQIDFKKIITDNLEKEGTFLNSYVNDRVFFGWQYDNRNGFYQRIQHPQVRRSPCLTWTEARKIIMDSVASGGPVDDYDEVVGRREWINFGKEKND